MHAPSILNFIFISLEIKYFNVILSYNTFHPLSKQQTSSQSIFQVPSSSCFVPSSLLFPDLCTCEGMITIKKHSNKYALVKLQDGQTVEKSQTEKFIVKEKFIIKEIVIISCQELLATLFVYKPKRSLTKSNVDFLFQIAPSRFLSSWKKQKLFFILN